ncbi:hypothetical protein [Natranaeroarchaeum aerophilus]|uniref:Uncharacterized protein n=1 Tax=Natranaeroarchaeum aerophilus TaxID=2917711 RepID=A0AAE3FTD0_9EURY|nr:hypothetical protein [Natranaeroarchaeum aerophilus]MCL9814770.1 hypothetical protein [Natranaeroarchaeum aerophilus]
MSDQSTRRSGISTRRDVLQAVGALSTTGAVAGLAGCLGGDDANGDEEPIDIPEFDLSSWVSAPGSVTGDDHYPFEFFSYEAFLALEDTLGEGPLSEDDYEEIEAGVSGEGSQPRPLPSLTGRPIDTFGEYLTVDNNSQQVLYGDHAPDAIGDGLVEDVGFEHVGSHGGFDLYLSELPGQPVDIAVGLSETVLLWVEDEYPADDVEALADTQTGETALYVDENEDMAELLDHIGGGARTLGETSDPLSETDLEFPAFEGQVGYGYDVALDGDPIDERYVIVFEDEDSVALDNVESWVGGEGDGEERFEPHTEVSTEQDGRSVVVSGTRETVDPFVGLYSP